MDCCILDEDRLLDSLEQEVALGGVVLEYHSADMFPERWIDSVWVARTDNSILYDRLCARGYTGIQIVHFHAYPNFHIFRHFLKNL